MIVTFIPAAGRSRRMRGGDKLLETIRGVPILRRTAQVAIRAGRGPVIVGLGPEAAARRDVLKRVDVTIIDVADADDGMAATLRAGARAALSVIAAGRNPVYDHSGMMVLLPDMPDVTNDDLLWMDRAFHANGGPCVRATAQDGTPGHPCIFPERLLAEFDRLSGDQGAARLFDDQRVVTYALKADRATRDLDTPEAWAAWRSETGIDR